MDHFFRGSIEGIKLERTRLDRLGDRAQRGDLAARQPGFAEIPVRHGKQGRGIERLHARFHAAPNGAGARDGKLLPDYDPGETLEALWPFAQWRIAGKRVNPRARCGQALVRAATPSRISASLPIRLMFFLWALRDATLSPGKFSRLLSGFCFSAKSPYGSRAMQAAGFE